jgi:hypothetical protein
MSNTLHVTVLQLCVCTSILAATVAPTDACAVILYEPPYDLFNSKQTMAHLCQLEPQTMCLYVNTAGLVKHLEHDQGKTRNIPYDILPLHSALNSI